MSWLFLSMAGSKFYFVDRSGLFNLSCPASCPNQTASDVLWTIHLMSTTYNLTVYCHNNGTCFNNNNLTGLLDILGDFTIVDNRLNFHYKVIYDGAYIGCVVRTNSCVDTHYYITNGSKFMWSFKASIWLLICN